ncbi:MAG: MerR family transcriptional regulator [Bacteroidia bacterium]|nr:MerR family transcriptional regulator [Bacteroidia bacterium]
MAEEEIEKIYFTIGEVSKELNLAPSLIRFWEKEFPELSPRKTEKGTRKYTRENIALLKLIYQLVKVEGFTLQGAREKLKAQGKTAETAALTEKLLNLKTFLIELKKQLD